jgi:ubiquinone/menaquinone biosynthesis C-methylase UbiE
VTNGDRACTHALATETHQVMTFKDYFSRAAAEYAAFRPTQPDALLAWVTSLARGRARAWDCGTGNGQVAVGLAKHFDRVIATDASVAQVEHAVPNARVEYRVRRAEVSGLQAASVDLVTAAQAVHWFDIPAFFAEARRVLAPGGAIAVWTYQTPTVSSSTDASTAIGDAFRQFAEVTVGPYWPPERQLINEGYRTFDFPFPEVPAPPFELRVEWTLTQLAGYMRTWSATARYIAALGSDPVDAFEAELAELIGEANPRCVILWPYAIRAGHAS